MARVIGIDVVRTDPTANDTLLVNVTIGVNDNGTDYEITTAVEIAQKSGNAYKPVSQLNTEVRDAAKVVALQEWSFPVNSYDNTWYSGGFA